MTARFVTFLVVLPRLMPPSEYGQLNLALTTVGLLIPVSVLGVPQATVRYFQEFRQRGEVAALQKAMLFQTLGASSLATLGVLGFALGLLYWSPGEAMGPLLVLTGLVLFCSSFTELGLGFYRARQQALRFSLVRAVQVGSAVSLGIGAILLFPGSALAFLSGQALAELVLAFLIIVPLIWSITRQATEQVRQVLAQAVRYGAPHVLVIFAMLSLTTGNRYVIKGVLDDSSVGTYALGFMIASSIMSLLTVPINQFIFPSYMSRWHQSGKEAVQRFLSLAGDLYLMVTIPIVVLGLALSEDLVVALGTAAYGEAAQVMPYILAGLAFNGLFLITSAPLYANDQVLTVGLITLVMAVTNLILSLLLVLWLGIPGAALANFLSLTVHTAVITLVASGFIRIQWHITEILRYVALSGVLGTVFLVIPDDRIYLKIAYAVTFLPLFLAMVYLSSKSKRGLLDSFKGSAGQ